MKYQVLAYCLSAYSGLCATDLGTGALAGAEDAAQSNAINFDKSEPIPHPLPKADWQETHNDTTEYFNGKTGTEDSAVTNGNTVRFRNDVNTEK